MRYLGIDVHVSSIAFHLLDETRQTLEHGKVATTVQALSALIARLVTAELLVGQEVGKMSHFVHDVLTGLGVKVLSLNVHQLRMSASSRKKSDKRDAYWIAKSLRSGMTPHPVYIADGRGAGASSVAVAARGVGRRATALVVASTLVLAGCGTRGEAGAALGEAADRRDGQPALWHGCQAVPGCRCASAWTRR